MFQKLFETRNIFAESGMHIKICHSRIFITLTFCQRGNKYFSGGRVYEKKRFRQKLFDGNINILTGIKIIVIILSNQLNRKSSRVFSKRRSTSKIMKHYIYLFSNLIRNALTFLHSLQLLQQFQQLSISISLGVAYPDVLLGHSIVT